MRIIRGTHGGRLIHIPKSFDARPTTDMAKEGLFNILENRYDLEGFRVVDLFGGSGSISFEFASRGAKSVITVESNHKHASFIRENYKTLGLSNIEILNYDVFKYLKKATGTIDFIFADPPYDLPNLATIPDCVLESNIMGPETVFVLEHSEKNDFSQNPAFREVRLYSRVHFSFFQRPKV